MGLNHEKNGGLKSCDTLPLRTKQKLFANFSEVYSIIITTIAEIIWIFGAVLVILNTKIYCSVKRNSIDIYKKSLFAHVNMFLEIFAY